MKCMLMMLLLFAGLGCVSEETPTQPARTPVQEQNYRLRDWSPEVSGNPNNFADAKALKSNVVSTPLDRANARAK